jgi:hypothetical protein
MGLRRLSDGVQLIWTEVGDGSDTDGMGDCRVASLSSSFPPSFCLASMSCDAAMSSDSASAVPIASIGCCWGMEFMIMSEVVLSDVFSGLVLTTLIVGEAEGVLSRFIGTGEGIGEALLSDT